MTEGQHTIECRDLRKRYGRTVAVDGLTFTVEPGRVTGFVGPNGAGKSTTMRMILGLDAPDGGSALVGGRPYRSLRTPLREVGALLDAGGAHPGRRAYHHLLWLAQSNGLPRRRIGEVLEQVGLAAVARRRTGGFSLGMRQRLGIAAALLGDPAVLIFDEPVNGLDPEGVHWIRGLLRGLAAAGRAVFVSSHLMSELADTADHLIIIGRCRLIADAGVPELISAASGRRTRVHTGQPAEVAAVLTQAGARLGAGSGGAIIADGLTGAEIAAVLAAHRLDFSELRPERVTLEEAYLALTRDADAVEYGAALPAGRD